MKKVVKQLVNLLFLIIVFPLYTVFLINAFVAGKDGSLSGISQLLSLLPGQMGNYTRRAFYRLALKKCSTASSIGFGTLIAHWQTEIGEGVYIGANCNLGTVKLENHVTMGSSVHVLSGNKQHFVDDLEKPIQDQGGVFKKITIGENCWIGNGSIIMANVGRCCIIGAGSVVTKEIEENSIVVGNPARVIKKRL